MAHPPRRLSSATIAVSLLTALLASLTLGAQGALSAPAPTAAPPRGGAAMPVRVLVLSYIPPDPNDPSIIDTAETGWAPWDTFKVADIEESIREELPIQLTYFGDASRYHGYKDSSAPASLVFSIARQVEYLTKMPLGYDLGGGNYRPNYHDILLQHNICDLVDNGGVKEVWIYGYHNGHLDQPSRIVPDESRMSSRYGDVSNSSPKEDLIPSEFKLPVCRNSYVLYNPTWQPLGNRSNLAHNRMHQIENVIGYAANTGYPFTDANTRGNLFWDDFSVYGPHASDAGYRASCGNTHAPPNVVGQEYLYNSQAYARNNCETWDPNDRKTTYVNANCTQWGCTEFGFYQWFMQNMPGYNNRIVYEGRQMRNWWEAMYDFNSFIDGGRSLYEQKK